MSDVIEVVCTECQGINRVPVTRLNDDARCGRCHKALFAGQASAVNATAFERQLSRSGLPLLVDFCRGVVRAGAWRRRSKLQRSSSRGSSDS